MLKKYLLLILFILLVFVSSDILAQSPPGGHVPPPNPIDGGLGILLALGVGYAVKKIRDKR